MDGRLEDMLKEFDASKGLDFSFGMENLSFSGADRGCENIGVVLEFRKGSQLVKRRFSFSVSMPL